MSLLPPPSVLDFLAVYSFPVRSLDVSSSIHVFFFCAHLLIGARVDAVATFLLYVRGSIPFWLRAEGSLS